MHAMVACLVRRQQASLIADETTRQQTRMLGHTCMSPLSLPLTSPVHAVGARRNAASRTRARRRNDARAWHACLLHRLHHIRAPRPERSYGQVNFSAAQHSAGKARTKLRTEDLAHRTAAHHTSPRHAAIGHQPTTHIPSGPDGCRAGTTSNAALRLTHLHHSSTVRSSAHACGIHHTDEARSQHQAQSRLAPPVRPLHQRHRTGPAAEAALPRRAVAASPCVVACVVTVPASRPRATTKKRKTSCPLHHHPSAQLARPLARLASRRSLRAGVVVSSSAAAASAGAAATPSLPRCPVASLAF